MTLSVFSITYYTRFIERDEDGEEVSSKPGQSPKNVVLAAIDQSAAVEFIQKGIPAGQQLGIQSIVTIAFEVEVVPVEPPAEAAQS